MKNPLSLESLRGWIATKPAEAAYNWQDSQSCLLGQYYKSIGASKVHATWWQDANGEPHDISKQFYTVALGDNLHVATPTYGAALVRAEKLIASGNAQ